MEKNMNTSNITIEIPEEFALALGKDNSKIQEEFKIAMAVWLYKLEKVSVGKAAELSGMNRIDFENLLSEMGISISNLTYDDIISDARKIN
jgi:predicted HTH domain antitoxin